MAFPNTEKIRCSADHQRSAKTLTAALIVCILNNSNSNSNNNNNIYQK